VITAPVTGNRILPDAQSRSTALSAAAPAALSHLFAAKPTNLTHDDVPSGPAMAGRERDADGGAGIDDIRRDTAERLLDLVARAFKVARLVYGESGHGGLPRFSGMNFCGADRRRGRSNARVTWCGS
jgi:hypothetical protein